MQFRLVSVQLMRRGLLAVIAVALLGAALLVPASAVAAPSNDDFANRIELAGALPITESGTNVEATREWQYEEVAPFAAGHSVWFKWTASVDGWVTVDTCTASFQTVLGIFTGSDVEHLTRVTKGNTSEMPGCSSSGRRFTFKAVSGTEYEIGVDGNEFSLPQPPGEPPPPPPVTEGEFTLRIEETPAPVNDDFAAATPIPGEVGEEPDGTRRYHAQVNGYNWKATTEEAEPFYEPGAGASVWYSWTPPETADYRISGACCGSVLPFALFTGDSLGALTQEPLGEFGEVHAIGGTRHWIAAYGKQDAETGEPSMGSFQVLIMAVLAPGPLSHPASVPSSPTQASPSPPDVIPPETKIDKTSLRAAARSAKFWFSASEPAQGFLCRLDKAPFKPCGSPRGYKHLKPGGHTFGVKAIDAAGNVDASPTVVHFRVPRPEKRR
jgi:hypothetical protein